MGGGAPSSLDVWSGCSLPGENRMLWHWVSTKDGSKELGAPISHLIPLSLPPGVGVLAPSARTRPILPTSPCLPWSRVQGGSLGLQWIWEESNTPCSPARAGVQDGAAGAGPGHLAGAGLGLRGGGQQQLDLPGGTGMDHQWLEPHGGGGRAGDGGGPAEGQLTFLPEAGPQVSPAPRPQNNRRRLGGARQPPVPAAPPSASFPQPRGPAGAAGPAGHG